MELSRKTKEYWEEKDWEDLGKAESIADLYKIALKVINRMQKPLVQVCGPITTGGMGSKEANLKVFYDTIKQLQLKELNVFDQMPFESTMQKIQNKLSKNGDYLHDILTDFYFPLFDSGVITAFYFMPKWETSFGARKEHEKAKKLGIKIIYL